MSEHPPTYGVRDGAPPPPNAAARGIVNACGLSLAIGCFGSLFLTGVLSAIGTLFL